MGNRFTQWILIGVLSISAITITLAQTDFKITSLKRTFKDNSTWSLITSKGTGNLRSTFSDGSEWELKFPGQIKYEIKQIFKGDQSEWFIKQGTQEVFFTISFKGDYNEWRTGEEKDFLYVKTVYKNNFAEWKGENNKGSFTIKSIFSDGSEWKITDNLKETPLNKIASVFAVLVSAKLRELMR